MINLNLLHNIFRIAENWQGIFRMAMVSQSKNLKEYKELLENLEKSGYVELLPSYLYNFEKEINADLLKEYKLTISGAIFADAILFEEAPNKLRKISPKLHFNSLDEIYKTLYNTIN